MAWLRLILDTDHEHTAALSEALEQAGAVAVTLEDAADQPLFEPAPGETPLWNSVRVVGLFPADLDPDALQDMLAQSLDPRTLGTLRIEPLEDRDWRRAWMDRFQPMCFGERVWIVPSWCEAPEPDAVNIALDPGMAFGTGTHPTTALCLEWLDGARVQGKRVLDYGCGSGILAIAAAKLGAAEVWAIDNDPQALLATRDNAEHNAVTLHTGLPKDTPQEPFDIVIANILAGPLVELAPVLMARLGPAGQLVLSGLLPEQADAIAHAYAPRCVLDQQVERDGWMRLSGQCM
ncbi:MAG: 50S ribosomal protein L11 methyltransferase [Granulosicoccaceae bacterium]|jgi:ribosomal protein L11 methyltransferase